MLVCMSMRAGLYLRVSEAERGKDNDATSRTIKQQESEERGDAERDGAEIAAVYTDDGASASRFRRRERDDYERLVADIERGQLDIVYAREVSRLQRDLEVYVKLRNLCRANGVLWSLNGKRYDFSRKGDRIASAFEAVNAEEEAEEIHDRAVRGIHTNVEAGRPRGRVLYGYRRHYDPHTGHLVGQVVDDDEGPVVRETADRVLAAESATGIAKDFARRGIYTRKGKEWDSSRIVKMLTNPSYAGKRVHQGEVVRDGTWPAIVSESEHERLVAILTDPRRGEHTGRENAAQHLLTRIAVCETCGHWLRVASNQNGKKQRYPSYICPAGQHVSRDETRLDAYVEAVMFRLLSRPDAASLVAADDGDGQRRAEAREEAEALRSTLQRYRDAATEGQMSEDSFIAMEPRLRERLADAEHRAKPVHVPESLHRLVRGTPEGVEREWRALTLEQQREAVRRLVTVTVHKAGKGGRFRPIHETVTVEPR